MEERIINDINDLLTQLFQKIHEAGYEWDADKKELKKIESQQAEIQKWSEEDEDNLTETCVAIRKFYHRNKLVVVAFVLGFYIGVKAGANGTLKVVKMAMDETLADVQKIEFLKSLERNKRNG